MQQACLNGMVSMTLAQCILAQSVRTQNIHDTAPHSCPGRVAFSELLALRDDLYEHYTLTPKRGRCSTHT
jgi:hypothetical protein